MFCFTLGAQDRSDIKYVRFINLDRSLIGKPVQLDFYNRSFRGLKLDTVTIVLDKIPIRFLEHRNDGGSINLFSSQFLESIDSLNQQRSRIIKFKIDRITEDSILVTCYLKFYDVNNVLIDKIKEMKTWFEKKMIIEILVKQ